MGWAVVFVVDEVVAFDLVNMPDRVAVAVEVGSADLEVLGSEMSWIWHGGDVNPGKWKGKWKSR
jgi:hypothetical protein